MQHLQIVGDGGNPPPTLKQELQYFLDPRWCKFFSIRNITLRSAEEGHTKARTTRRETSWMDLVFMA